MPKTAHRALLTDFLKIRRARLKPAQVGLPEGDVHVRRTPGLRRSEVARLAGLSTEWYTLFEMGRDRAMTMRVVDPVSHALRLTGIERDYLYDLVRAASPPRRTAGQLHPSLEFGLTHVKEAAAIIYDPWLTHIRWNRVAEKIFRIVDTAWLERNALWRLFVDDRLREMINVDWESHARHNLGIFRRALARDPLNASARTIVRALQGNEEFERLWAEHEVSSFDLYSSDNANAPYVMQHPAYGQFSMHVLILEIPGWPGAHVRYMTPGDEHGVEIFRQAASGS